MIFEHNHITEACSLIKKSIEQLSEGQLTFTSLAIMRDLDQALMELEAVQTVILPPLNEGDLTNHDV